MSTKKRMSATLPATPCTDEMRDSLVKVAEREGKSIAEVQRDAFSLFLAQNDSLTITKVSKIEPKEKAS